MVEGVGSVDSGSNTAVSRAGLQQEDFLKVLLAQLTFQDPLKPLDNNEFIAQFAQITSLQQTQQTNDRLDNLLSFQSTNQAIGLLDRIVNVESDGGLVVGKVVAIRFQQGVPLLDITDTTTGASLLNISLNQVSAVRPLESS